MISPSLISKTLMKISILPSHYRLLNNTNFMIMTRSLIHTTSSSSSYYNNYNTKSKSYPHFKSPTDTSEVSFNKKTPFSSIIFRCREFSSDSTTTSTSGTSSVKEGEVKIKSILSQSFPNAKEIIVQDISGGCGSMYQVYVEADEFKGLSIVKQHQLVNKVLSQEIKAMHGIRIQTQVPPSN